MPPISYHSGCCRQPVLCFDLKWNGAFVRHCLAEVVYLCGSVQSYMHRWIFKTAQLSIRSSISHCTSNEEAVSCSHTPTPCVVLACVIFLLACAGLSSLFTSSTISSRSLQGHRKDARALLVFFQSSYSASLIPKARLISPFCASAACIAHTTVYTAKSTESPPRLKHNVSLRLGPK